MNISLRNKVAVVTGASTGIGLACAELLSTSGAAVALISRNWERLYQAGEKVTKTGPARCYQLDVTNIHHISNIVQSIRSELGEIDILVCNAGIDIHRQAHEFTESDWDSIMSTNAKGLFFCNKEVAIQSMIPRKSGSIINMASQMGVVGGPERAVYCASKGAVIQLTKAEAIDWAPFNLRVNAVAPTFVKSPMTEETLNNPSEAKWIMANIPLKKLATVEDVASVVCFLASDLSAMITGSVIPIDGGWTAH